MDIVLTTNSPGEVSAWVKPMVKVLKQKWPESRITVFIPPCNFASGQEVPVVRKFPEVDLAIGPKAYIRYVLTRRKPRDFHPGKDGFVLFLGGDLGHAVLLGKRLNYPVYAYSERAAGHAKSIRLFFVSNSKVAERLQRKGNFAEQIRVVGDLMLDAVNPEHSVTSMEQVLELQPDDFVLNVFPGSRPHEVQETLPFFLLSVLKILEKRKIVPLITVAPFISLHQVSSILAKAQGFQWELRPTVVDGITVLQVNQYKLLIYQGLSYDTMQISDLAIALPGTNNVELTAMGVPVMVVLPLNWPELIPLPGVVGMLGQIPLIGAWFKRQVVIPKLLPKFKYVSPVNRNYNQLILPELVGVLTPEMVATSALKLIDGEILTIQQSLAQIEKREMAAEQIISQIASDLLSFQ